MPNNQEHDKKSELETQQHGLIVNQVGSWELNAYMGDDGEIKEDYSDREVHDDASVECHCGREFNLYEQKAIDHLKACKRIMPDSWKAGIGERSEGQNYTKFFYHDDYEIRVYWDDGQDHKAVIRPKEEDEDGNMSTGYAIRTAYCDTEDEATDRAYEWMYAVERGDIEQ